jgi:hypothetical protein
MKSGDCSTRKRCKRSGLFEANRHQGVFPLDPTAMQDAGYGVDEFLGIAMLADEFKSAVAHGTDGRVDRLVATEDDHRRRHMLVQHPFHDVQPIDVGQIEIEDQDIDVALLKTMAGFLAGAALLDEAPPRQQAGAGRLPGSDPRRRRSGFCRGSPGCPDFVAKSRNLRWPSWLLPRGVRRRDGLLL